MKLYKRKGQQYPAVLPPRTCKLLLWRTSTVVCRVFKKEPSHPSSGPGTDSWDLLQFVHGTAALPFHGHLLSDFLRKYATGTWCNLSFEFLQTSSFKLKAQTMDVVSMSMAFIGRLTSWRDMQTCYIHRLRMWEAYPAFALGPVKNYAGADHRQQKCSSAPNNSYWLQTTFIIS